MPDPIETLRRPLEAADGILVQMGKLIRFAGKLYRLGRRAHAEHRARKALDRAVRAMKSPDLTTEALRHLMADAGVGIEEVRR